MIAELAKYCAYIYEDTPDYISPLDVECKLYGRALIIQGSDSLLDWQTNFTAFPTRQGYHAGFYSAFMSIESWVNDFKDEFDVVAGHSAGGAIAQFCTDVFEKPAVCFGAPKTGISSPDIVCYSNVLDFVTKLPLFVKNKNVKHNFLALSIAPHSMSVYLARQSKHEHKN